MEAINMKIAVLSGKGGAGKTFVSVNLAAVSKNSVYIDCDVEEPNGHLFLKPVKLFEEEVKVKIPFVDNTLCDGCRKCVDFCKFNALAYVKNKLFIFDEVCHSCGGCIMVCGKGALTEKEKAIGKIEKGVSDKINVSTGILNIGETSGVPIIKELLEDKNIVSDFMVFIDCPPGSACVVMESIKDADYCVLVAEPTVFGVHNLNMIYELVKLFGKKHGVIINKSFEEETLVKKYCLERNIKILGQIPFDNELGILNSSGEISAYKNEKFRLMFLELLDKILQEADYETAINT